MQLIILELGLGRVGDVGGDGAYVGVATHGDDTDVLCPAPKFSGNTLMKNCGQK